MRWNGEGQLREAFTEITQSIARCVFTIDPMLALEPRLEVLIDGAVIDREPSHGTGWDWTDPENGELTIFGPDCDRAARAGATITSRLGC